MQASLNDLVEASSLDEGNSFSQPKLSRSAAARRLDVLFKLVAPVNNSNNSETNGSVGALIDGGVGGFDGISAAVSVGISNSLSWDLDAAARGIPVLQFDHSVAAPSVSSPLFTFERLKVVGADTSDGITLEKVLQTRIRPGSGSLTLKLDMDFCDVEIISTLDELILTSFEAVFLQFHRLERLDDEAFKASVSSALSRLSNTHFVARVHANGCVDLLRNRGEVTPTSAEICFRLRKRTVATLVARASHKTLTYSGRNDRPGGQAHLQNAADFRDAVAAGE